MSTYNVYSGDSFSSVVLGAEYTLSVYFGGTATATTVGNGGAVYVDGGIASATQVHSGGGMSSPGVTPARW
jgi:autotransporter passenger strand-loop-strand repeat protein